MIIRVQKKMWLTAIALVAIMVVAFSVSQIFMLQKAHSTFDNYYAFRGCVKLLEKTDTYGVCQLASGKTIKIVLFKGKWYLDGDLPYPGINFL